MSTLPQDMAQVLADGGMGQPLQDIFMFLQGDEPDRCIVVRTYGGERPEHTKDVQAPSLRHRRFQTYIRERSGEGGKRDAEVWADEILLTLSGFRGAVNGNGYHVEATGEPSYLGVDGQDRNQFVINFETLT